MVDLWRELDFERRQRANVRGRTFVDWRNLEVFAILPRERDVLYCPFKDSWDDFEGSRALGISTPVVFLCLRGKIQTGTVSERDLIEKIAEVEFDVMTLGVFLRCARYGPVEPLAYPQMMAGCGGDGALLFVLLATIK